MVVHQNNPNHRLIRHFRLLYLIRSRPANSPVSVADPLLALHRLPAQRAAGPNVPVELLDRVYFPCHLVSNDKFENWAVALSEKFANLYESSSFALSGPAEK